MAYGVYSDRGYREHILERNKNTNKTEVFTQEDQTFAGRKTFLSGVTTSDLKAQTVEVSESLKVKGKDITGIIDYLPNDVSKENKLTTEDFVNSSILSGVTTSNLKAQTVEVSESLKVKGKDITGIIDYLPNDVSKENKLTTENFVNSSIATNTANFLGTFNTLEEIEALTDVTNNDYAFWKTTDTLGSVVFKRYKYIADERLWKFEYDLNNSSFTAAQWDAINSGITEELVAQIGQGGGSALVPSITIAQYDNLTEAEKNNGQIREITNTNPKKVMLNGMDLFVKLKDAEITTSNVWSAAKTKAKIDANHKYSTDETKIGEWIDGKTIYRKVFPITFNYTSSMRNVTKDIYNVSHVIHCYGVDYNNNNGCLYLRGCSKNGYLQAMSENTSGSCTQVIFEYTKTTN